MNFEDTILDNLVLFNLDIHTWSGRKKLHDEDVEGKIPPKKLASLGSKKICDPQKVAKFASIKRRAERLLASKGIRLMGAYGIPADRVPEVVNELRNIRNEFESVKSNFINTYHAGVESWIEEQGEWGKIIRSHITPVSYIRKQLSFGWQVFHVRPTNADSEGLEEEFSSVADKLFEEISKASKEVFEKQFLMKPNVSQVSLNSVRKIKDKLNGLAFVDGKASAINELMSDTLSAMPKTGTVEGRELHQLSDLLVILSDKDKIVEYGQRIIDGEDITLVESKPDDYSEAVDSEHEDFESHEEQLALDEVDESSQTPTDKADESSAQAWF